MSHMTHSWQGENPLFHKVIPKSDGRPNQGIPCFNYHSTRVFPCRRHGQNWQYTSIVSVKCIHFVLERGYGLLLRISWVYIQYIVYKWPASALFVRSSTIASENSFVLSFYCVSCATDASIVYRQSVFGAEMWWLDLRIRCWTLRCESAFDQLFQRWNDSPPMFPYIDQSSKSGRILQSWPKMFRSGISRSSCRPIENY